MNRRTFIKNSCAACMGMGTLGAVMQSCTTAKYITGKIVGDHLVVPLKEFTKNSKNGSSYLSYIIIRPDALQYPVCVYRFSETMYSALWMRCTHQGVELQAAGDRLQCPAHGSEFGNRGMVKLGPAEENLRTFPVSITNNELLIDLRKQ